MLKPPQKRKARYEFQIDHRSSASWRIADNRYFRLVQADQRVTLAWDPPAGQTNIGGYYLYYGAASGNYTNVISLRYESDNYHCYGFADGVTYFFVVTAHRSGLESNPSNETNFTAPTILGINDWITREDTPISVPFTIGDMETPSLLLKVTGESSDQNLVPNGNLFLDGWETNRTLTIIPSPDQSGTTTITLSVNDGTATASTSFVLTVDSVNDPPTLEPLDDVALLAVAGQRRVSAHRDNIWGGGRDPAANGDGDNRQWADFGSDRRSIRIRPMKDPLALDLCRLLRVERRSR